uniref:Uncharacterized protein n=1 Tax=Anguilla anguilla TaxID=7936 RepID=A0A0E9RI95_ANGAN
MRVLEGPRRHRLSMGYPVLAHAHAKSTSFFLTLTC